MTTDSTIWKGTWEIHTIHGKSNFTSSLQEWLDHIGPSNALLSSKSLLLKL